MEFSNSTATLLKTKLPYEQLAWSNDNILDLANIKQLKGCRIRLVRNCLRFIQKLDTDDNFNGRDKDFLVTTIHSLVENLKEYIKSCERYPRIKDFLNIIPDNCGSIIGVIFVITSLIAIKAFPALAIIPLAIIFWIGMDLFFNNRTAAENLKIKLYAAKTELNTLLDAHRILEQTKTKNPSQTNVSPPSPIPGSSRVVYSSFKETESDLPSCSYSSVNNTTKTVKNNPETDPLLLSSSSSTP